MFEICIYYKHTGTGLMRLIKKKKFQNEEKARATLKIFEKEYPKKDYRLLLFDISKES